MSKVELREVTEDEGDTRLDRWLRRLHPHLGQGRIEKMCRKGEVRVDGSRAKPNTRLEAGQTVRIPPVPEPDAVEVERRKVAAQPKNISDKDAEMMRASVIWRDETMIAINKPPGLPVQGGSKLTRHVDGLADALRFGMDEKPRLVHRLDKDTSGILLLARTGLAAKQLTAAFRHHETRKIYWAAVAGAPRPAMGTIRFGLVKAAGHGTRGEGERMHCIHPRDIKATEGAKRATTDYATIEAVGRRAAWMALVPITGRTHQLRAHMAEIGHPIVGDGKYGGSVTIDDNGEFGATLGGAVSRKLHLHARSLTFKHPISKRQMTLKADMHEHMLRTWDFFGWDPKEAPDDPFEDEEAGWSP